MSGDADSFMPLYVGDYIADTMELTTLEHGAYLLLLFHYWRTGNPLPSGDEVLARITRLSRSQWDSMSVRIRKFFREVDQDGEVVLTHKRVESEMARATGKYEASKKGAETTNAKRWGARGSSEGGGRRKTAKSSHPVSQPDSPSHEGEAREPARLEGGGGAPCQSLNPHTEKLKALKASFGSDAYWLSEAQILEDDAGMLHLSVPKKVQADKLRGVYWVKLDYVLGEGKYAIEQRATA